MDRSLSRSNIALLPELVRNQIAAGEVIERPASVVKELVENALDAGASRITVDLEEGGVKLVRITDDGCGIPHDELEIAFAAHATSKLGQVEDLDHIATLGFRGEALASIASVARCRMFSRTRASELGAGIDVEGGALGPVREAGGAVGTRIEVRALFYNTPARRRFLKTTATELGRCIDVVQRLALAQVGVGFVVTHDGRRVFEVEPSMDLRSRVRRTFGAELADALVAVEASDDSTRIEGFVAPPRFARNDTTRQMWFLNGRPLRDKLLSRILREAHRGLIVDNKQPIAFLSLALDPARVDVNVHPAKAEVRFRDERRIFGFLVAAIRRSVQTIDMATPGAQMLDTALARDQRDYGSGSRAVADTRPFVFTPVRAPTEQPVFVRDPAPAEVSHPQDSAPPRIHERDPREIRGPLVQIAKTYIVRPLDDGFEIVDQHALHERLTLELLREELERGRIEVQRRLVPDVVEVGAAGAQALEPHLEALAGIGFHFARFGPGAIAVNGLPARLRKPDPEGIVRDVLDSLERTGATPGSADLLENVLHRAACRSSVMAGDELSELEMRALLARARETDHDQTCAHGRPTRVRFTLNDLERAFQRR